MDGWTEGRNEAVDEPQLKRSTSWGASADMYGVQLIQSRDTFLSFHCVIYMKNVHFIQNAFSLCKCICILDFFFYIYFTMANVGLFLVASLYFLKYGAVLAQVSKTNCKLIVMGCIGLEEPTRIVDKDKKKKRVIISSKKRCSKLGAERDGSRRFSWLHLASVSVTLCLCHLR